MPATWFLVRSALRRRAGTWVVLGLVVALGVGAGLAGLAGARRTASAYPRFLTDADAPELIADVDPLDTDDVDALAAALRDLPGVQGSADAAAFAVARFVDGRPDYSYPGNFLAPLDDRRYRTEDRPALLDGRLPDPASTDEVLVNRTFADQHGIGVGDRLELGYVTAEQVDESYRTGAQLDPVDVAFVVVGVGLLPEELLHDDLTAESYVIGTPAWARAHPEGEVYRRIGLQLAPGADGAAVQAAAQDTATGASSGLLFQDRTAITAQAQRATRPFALALALVGGVVLLAAAAISAQSFARAVDQAADDLPAIRAMGATTSARAVAVLGPGVVAVGAGLLGAVVVAVVLSPFAPVGPNRSIEPDPGPAFDALALGGGVLAALLLIGVRMVPGAVALVRRGQQTAVVTGRTGLAATFSRIGGNPPVVLGIRSATEPGAGRTRVPVRATIAGVALAVASLVAVVTFDAGRGQLLGDPSSYGWAWDAAIQAESGYGQLDVASMSEDPLVVGMAAATFAPVLVDGHDVSGIALSPLVGDVTPPVVQGRIPSGPGEIALGAETMRAVGASLGDTVDFSLGAGDHRAGDGERLRVVGEVILPAIGLADTDRPGLGRGALMVIPLDEIGADAGTVLLQLADPGHGSDPLAALRDRYADPMDSVVVVGAARPADVASFDRLGAGPAVILGAFAVAALAAVLHGIVTSARRRGRDLAVLRVLGFESGQIRTVVIVQTATVVAAAVLVGVPAGLIAGRWAWRSLAEEIGVLSPATLPFLAIAAVSCGLLVAALAASLIPAHRASRIHPATALRTE
jgi:hypothetical protein